MGSVGVGTHRNASQRGRRPEGPEAIFGLKGQIWPKGRNGLRPLRGLGGGYLGLKAPRPGGRHSLRE